jgi:hypothetical protein
VVLGNVFDTWPMLTTRKNNGMNSVGIVASGIADDLANCPASGKRNLGHDVTSCWLCVCCACPSRRRPDSRAAGYFRGGRRRYARQPMSQWLGGAMVLVCVREASRSVGCLKLW